MSSILAVNASFFQAVLDAMQNCEEMGGPEGDQYDAVMLGIANEAMRRIITRRINDGDPVNPQGSTVADELVNIDSVLSLAIDAVERGFSDEALLHLNMASVYLGRLKVMPQNLLGPYELERIVDSLHYHFDMTENQEEDRKNKAIVSLLCPK